MKLLNGKELAEFIQQRQLKQVRSIRQSLNVEPKLAILKTIDDPVIDTYVRLKQKYGADINVDVEVFTVPQKELAQKIIELNSDESFHGIIIQLPLQDSSQTTELLNLVALEKDVDGLAAGSSFDPATPLAITWLLDGFNVETKGKTVAIIGKGRLVGAPLERIFTERGIEVASYDNSVKDLAKELMDTDIIISATGVPGLITSAMVKQKAVIIDAGVAVDSGKTIGDVAEDVYARNDITITPKKGGVGPLTVCALFENVLLGIRQSS